MSNRPYPMRAARPALTLIAGVLLAFALLFPITSRAQDADLDAFWTEVSRTVGEGDFDGYAATYHEDAVLVSGGGGVSYPISDALAGWKPDFDRTRRGEVSARVAFRFSSRLTSPTTAHETGLFRYRMDAPDSDAVDAIVHFEALLVKKDGRWLMVMEYQKEPGTAEEWARAASE